MTTAERTARSMVAARTTEQIVQDFELTEEVMAPGLALDDHIAVVTTRGWMLDELEKRNPEAMERWLDADVDSPRRFFL